MTDERAGEAREEGREEGKEGEEEEEERRICVAAVESGTHSVLREHFYGKRTHTERSL